MRARDSHKITGTNETVLRALLEKSSGKIVSVPDRAYAQERFSYTSYSDIYIRVQKHANRDQIYRPLTKYSYNPARGPSSVRV